MKKRVFSFLLAVCTVLSLTMTSCAAQEVPEEDANPSPVSAVSQDLPFTDIPADAWYADAVQYCYENGIFAGTSDTAFSPDTTLSRAMLATTFYRMAGSPSLEEENLGYPFSDVPGDSWYADGVYWARMEGVVGGYGNNAFGPDDPVTREQAMTILWRYAGSPTASSGTFSDSADLADWAVSAAGWAQAMGLLTGWADSSLQPQTPLTRAEAAVLLARYLEGGGSGTDSAAPVFNFETRTVLLNSGYEMPIMGLGTYSLSDEECYNSVTALLEAGGRLIDTAYMYHNEEAVGRAIRDSGVPREEIFVITKLYPSQFSDAETAIDEAMEKLDIGYIDLMLLHHPGTGDVEAYHAMEQAVADGKIRSIGLSNWYIEELEEFLPQVNITPALVQNEIHPYYQEQEVVPYIQSLGIVTQGWYPFGGRGHTAELLGDPVISAIAEAHGVTSAQVILRWNLQRGVVVIPGSSNPDHIRENLDLFGFELTDEEMAQIAALERGEKHDWY